MTYSQANQYKHQ